MTPRRWPATSGSIDGRCSPGQPAPSTDSPSQPVELGSDLGPEGFAETWAPLLAPYPCDHALARDHLLEGADPLRLQELGAVPGAIDALAGGLVDSVAHGYAGLIRDLTLQVAAPDINLDDVGCPVELWYGSADASPPFGRWFSDHLPHAVLTVLPGAGHCFLLPRWAEILGSCART